MALITVAGVIFAFCAPRFGDAALSAVERFGFVSHNAKVWQSFPSLSPWFYSG
jgi:hypothetical protein